LPHFVDVVPLIHSHAQSIAILSYFAKTMVMVPDVWTIIILPLLFVHRVGYLAYVDVVENGI
jgi:hypothetical protein